MVNDAREPIPTNKVVKLESLDNQLFEIELEAALNSEMIKDALQLDDQEEDSHEGPYGPVQLLRVGSQCLDKVVAFLKQHHKEPLKEIPCPLGASTFEEVVTQQWYQSFCDEENMPQDMLFEVLRAANYLGIPALLDLTCLKVTFQLQGKNAEEIREMLNLPTLSAEEEARAREEHRWIFENA